MNLSHFIKKRHFIKMVSNFWCGFIQIQRKSYPRIQRRWCERCVFGTVVTVQTRYYQNKNDP